MVPADLLELALTHRSYAYEHGGPPTNERLEFLGDAVLGLIVTEALYEGYPDLAEGDLAKLRAAVVNRNALAGVARCLGLGPHVRLGRGEEATGGRSKASILADTLEALIGAVYLGSGVAACAPFVRRLFDPLIAESVRTGSGLDWKTKLQELAAAAGLGVPEYLVDESGPDHAKRFRATVWVAGRSRGTGDGGSKKEAEQGAARAACASLRLSPASADAAPGGPDSAGPAGITLSAPDVGQPGTVADPGARTA